MRDLEGPAWSAQKSWTWSPHTKTKLGPGNWVDIIGATKTAPVVITTQTNHGFENDDIVQIRRVRGMTDLNGNYYTVANKTDKTFELRNAQIARKRDYRSGGQVCRASQIVKIARITKANPVVVTTRRNHGFENGDIVQIKDVDGMTQLNGNHYTVAGKTKRTFNLTDDTGATTNGTSFGTHTPNTGKVRPQFGYWVEASYLTDPNFVTASGVTANRTLVDQHTAGTMGTERRLRKTRVQLRAEGYLLRPEDIVFNTRAAATDSTPGQGEPKPRKEGRNSVGKGKQ